MGQTEYMMGGQTPSPSNLPESIDDLQDLSTVFMQRWAVRDLKRAGDISKRAMVLLDFIVSDILRERGVWRRARKFTGSPFESEMNRPLAQGLTAVTVADQMGVRSAGAGNGRLPPNVGKPVLLTFERLLNKIKHRNQTLTNFRIESGRHIFVVCPEEPSTGAAEGKGEFDVG